MKIINTFKYAISLMTFLAFPSTIYAQGNFQNLNFEQANPVAAGSPYPADYVTTASALPSWTVTIGNSQPAAITENSPAVGSTWVMLCGPNSQSDFAPLDGNYSVLLQGGGTAAAAAISQTGIIPATAETLLVDVAAFGSGSFDLSIGNQNLALSTVATDPGFTVYAASISEWAGQNEQLTISVPEFSGNYEFDDITFSTQAVPEPNTVELVLMAATMLGLQGWRKRGKFLPSCESDNLDGQTR